VPLDERQVAYELGVRYRRGLRGDIGEVPLDERHVAYKLGVLQLETARPHLLGWRYARDAWEI